MNILFDVIEVMPVWLRLKMKSVRPNWEKYTKVKKTAWKSYKTVGAVKIWDFY